MIQEKVVHETRFPTTVVLTPPVSIGSVILLCVALSAGIAFYGQAPPNTVAASAMPAEFSSARAMKHLEVIARQSHPMGTSEHAVVRDYIVQALANLGLSPVVQKTTAVNRRPGIPWLSGTVENVMARVKGTSDGKAVMLVCHYDSVPTGPGASDDGSAVAALLETARALKAGPPLKNDVILLFTDGEEAGLLGASAFVEHPWASQVALALNFEARGSGGPVLMFETSRDNFNLIKTLAQSVPYPRANSLFYEVYRRLPNDTDYTLFKQAGMQGLNFAFIDPSTNYHTQLDSIAHIDERSLQHQGSYALALAQAFGNAQLTASRGNAVYFDLAGAFLIYYPVTWVVPVAVLLIVMFAGALVLGFRKGKLTIGGIALGALAALLAIAGSWLLVSLVWRIVRAVHKQYDLMPSGDTYNSRLYLFAFAALTLAFTAAIYVLASKRVSFQNLWAGALIWWLVLLVFTALALPGASYLFTWPLFFSIVALGVTFVIKGDALRSVKAQAGVLLGAVTGVILFGPLIYLLFIGLTVRMSAAVMVMLALVLTLFIPQNDLMRVRKPWLLPVSLLIVCAGFLVAGSLTSGFSNSRPLQDHVLYGSNAATQQAVWITSNSKPDTWTSQFFSPEMKRSSLPDLFPFSSREYLISQAPFVAQPAPNIEKLSDDVENGVRKLRVRFTTQRQAAVISVGVEGNMPIECTSINATPIRIEDDNQQTNRNKWGIRYFAPPPEGVELTLETRSDQPLVFKIVDQSYGLPSLPNSFKARPENTIPAPVPTSDSTLVARSFTF